MSPGDRARAPAAASVPGGWTPWAPVAGVIMLLATIMILGWQQHLSFEKVAAHYETLKAFVAGNLLVSILIYILAYVGLIAVSLPINLVMLLTGGLLFGWGIGSAAAIVGSTLGATVFFLLARSTFGRALAARAGPRIGRLRAGFQKDALSYLLFLRLVTVVPFWLVNLAPAFLGVPLRTYVIGTAIGIIPGTIAFTLVGAGLGNAVEAQNRIYAECQSQQSAGAQAECVYRIDTGALVTNEMLTAFVLLALLALTPVVYKRWSQRNASN